MTYSIQSRGFFYQIVACVPNSTNMATVVHHIPVKRGIYGCSCFVIGKRFRKRERPPFWRYMYRGKQPFSKHMDQNEQDTIERRKRVLRNQRSRGRTLMDWVSMPHLQYVMSTKER